MGHLTTTTTKNNNNYNNNRQQLQERRQVKIKIFTKYRQAAIICMPCHVMAATASKKYTVWVHHVLEIFVNNKEKKKTEKKLNKRSKESNL